MTFHLCSMKKIQNNNNMKVTGKTLVNLGFRQGKWFKDAIEYLNENELTETEMKAYLDSIAPLPPIDLHAEPVHFYKNISAKTEEEAQNIKKVIETMNVLMKTPTLVDGAIMPHTNTKIQSRFSLFRLEIPPQ